MPSHAPHRRKRQGKEQETKIGGEQVTNRRDKDRLLLFLTVTSATELHAPLFRKFSYFRHEDRLVMIER